LRSPDYVTISYCKFSHRYWTVAYGTQNTETTRDRTTLLYNWWNENVRRRPQLGNGSAHVYNNYFTAYGVKSNGSATTGIIGGDGSNMVSQNNRFQGYIIGQVLTMGNDPSRDDNSFLATEVNGTPSRVGFTPKSKSSWYPNQSNYGYLLLDAYNTKGTDTKTFYTKYAGCFTSDSGIKYITDSDFSSWVTTNYASPFLTKANFFVGNPSEIVDTTLPYNPPTNSNNKSNPRCSDDIADKSNSGLKPQEPQQEPEPEPELEELDFERTIQFNDGATYMFKNVNSNLYIDIDGAKAADGTNAQQRGANEPGVQNTFKLASAGDNSYYIVSLVNNNANYVLDVSGNKSNNGANIHIYRYTGSNNQKFTFSKNTDGTYKILTKDSGGKSL